MDERAGAGPRKSADTTADDAELHANFARLRAADARGLPAIDTLLDTAAAASVARERREVDADAHVLHHPATRAWQRHWRMAARVALPLAAAAVLAFVVFTRTTPEARFRRTVMAYAADPALGAWRSPTAFLLEFPGHDLLTAVPRIGEPIAADTTVSTQDAGPPDRTSPTGSRSPVPNRSPVPGPRFPARSADTTGD